MKKHFPIIFLVLGLLLFSRSPLQAGDKATWTIKWNGNGSLDEEVIISNQNVVINDQQWETSHSGNQMVLSRHIKDWQAYSQLSDSLPLEVAQRDFLILKIASLTVKQEANPGNLFEQLSRHSDASLNIEVSGFIRNSNAEFKQDTIAVWNLATSRSSPLKLDVVIFDGIILCISIFIFCFIIIFIIYLNRIRRVNRLITEEYSLERAALEFAQGENDNQEEE